MAGDTTSLGDERSGGDAVTGSTAWRMATGLLMGTDGPAVAALSDMAGSRLGVPVACVSFTLSFF